MDYTTLSIAEVKAGLEDVARDAQSAFGGLDARQLNWRPDATRWSVAQCVEHLLVANRLMIQSAVDAIDGTRPRTVWQRLPIWPGVLGRMLIRSQAPGTTRKFKAPPLAQPAASAVAADIVQQFVAQHADAVARLGTLGERDAASAIMTSPFIRVITYSVLDGWRLIVAHDHRHIAQARRVMQAPGFPAS
jgi:hypothetical protein